MANFRANEISFSTLTIANYYISQLTDKKIRIWQKFMCIEHEHGPKPHSGPLLALIEPILGSTKSFTAF